MSRTLLAGALVATTALVAPAQAAMPESFADLVEQVSPAVVTILGDHAMGAEEGQGPAPMPFPVPPGSPFEEFFKRFGAPEGPREGPRPHGMAMGSGFIVDADGYVVTNNHVIDEADAIKVVTKDGTEYEAKLVGHDPATDLALLKIDADRPLPTVAWGDSDTLRVGDWVVAVGNPFGLGGTVTAGILSARGRDLGSGPLDDFLQIDAPINRGNSGGPTFDTSGKVVGVNTAIYSPSGGSVGIGFAIPSDLAQEVIADLRDDGRIERGWIGVQIQEVTPEIAEGLRLPEPKGALVAGVVPDGPAAEAGLEAGDVVLRFGDHEIATMRDLPRIVTGTTIGDSVPVTVWRDGKEMTLETTVARRDEEALMAADEQGGRPFATADSPLGLALAPVTEEARQQFGIPAGVKGALIVDVAEGGPAAEKGVRPGDVIVQIAADPVASPADVARLVEEARVEKMKAVLLLINRGGNERFVAVPLDKA
jgi:serine protease Do